MPQVLSAAPYHCAGSGRAGLGWLDIQGLQWFGISKNAIKKKGKIHSLSLRGVSGGSSSPSWLASNHYGNYQPSQKWEEMGAVALNLQEEARMLQLGGVFRKL